MYKKDQYEHPLITRYATKEMSLIWSPKTKFETWRKLWLALAISEKNLGLPITDIQINEMKENLYTIDYNYADEMEKNFRHDVMAHIHTFGKIAPNAMPIIHLGATSCYVGDNTDIIQMKMGLQLIKTKLLLVLNNLKEFSLKYKNMPTMGFTHFQPAQLVTVGKRGTLWLQDFYLDYEKLELEINNLPFRGIKGTTGTQASFLHLFDNDHEKVKKLDQLIAKEMGFTKSIYVSGQTYTRKIDFFITSILSGISQSAYKMANDIRLLASRKEIEEPFEKNQIGSSAMAYKRNPMRCERICSLARYVMSLTDNTAQTHSNQWFERTLDDSANRRIVLPEIFLAIDVILNLVINVTNNLQVWPNVIKNHIEAELPFMATENILMACVKLGKDRQEIHEAIREHSMVACSKIKEDGSKNDLIDRILKDNRFCVIHNDLKSILDPMSFIGRCPEQVDEFIQDIIQPLLNKNKDIMDALEIDPIHV